MSRRPPAGFVALTVVSATVGGIIYWVLEGQKRERQVTRYRATLCICFLRLAHSELRAINGAQTMRQAVYRDIEKLGR